MLIYSRDKQCGHSAVSEAWIHGGEGSCDLHIAYVHFNANSVLEIIYLTVRSAGSMQYIRIDYAVGGTLVCDFWKHSPQGSVCSPLVLFYFVFISALLQLSPHRRYRPSVSTIVKGSQRQDVYRATHALIQPSCACRANWRVTPRWNHCFMAPLAVKSSTWYL